MGFAYLDNKNKYKQLTVIPSGSVRAEENPMLIGKNDLSQCENMLWRDGLLRTRDGFYTDSEMEVCRIEDWDYCVKPLTFAKGDFFLFGKRGVIGYLIVSDGYSYQKVKVYFFDGELNKTELGEHIFSRLDDNNFFVPEEILFFSGASSGGGGIYMAVYAVSGETEEIKKDFYIYEINSTFDGWGLKDNTGYYVPTLCYNGKGNNFSQSVLANDSTFGKTIELEQQNMLTGHFYAYYSSDGFSDTFQLPLSKLDDETVIIRYNYRKDFYYEWVIGAGEQEDEIELFSTKVRAVCNRLTGTVSFYQSGELYALPRMAEGFGNNIKITACKTVADGLRCIITSKGAVTYKSNLIFYGNEVNPAEIYLASIKNPLYFPKDTKVTVGTEKDEVTAVKVLKDKIAVLKKGGIYSLKIIEGGIITYNELISEVERQFYKSSKIEYTPISDKTGCDNPDTVMSIEDGIVWLNKDSVYCLRNTSSNNIGMISGNIKSALRQAVKNCEKKIFGFINENYYGLVLGQSIIVADIDGIFDVDKVRWYTWNIPSDLNLSMAAELDGKSFFACCNSRENLNYLSIPSGEYDIVPDFDGSIKTEKENSVKSGFSTSRLRLDCTKIEAAEFNIGSQSFVDISFLYDLLSDNYKIPINLKKEELEKNIFRKIKIYPSLMTNNTSVKIQGKAPFYLESIKIFYR